MSLKMGEVMIKCPTTGKPIYPGIALPKESYEKSSFEDNEIGCPHCRKTHTWSKRDTEWVEKREPGS